MTKLMLPLFIVLGSPIAYAQTPPSVAPSREVEVEVRDQAAGKAEVARFRLAVAGTGAPSMLASNVADASYDLKLRQDQPGTSSIALELSRHSAIGRVVKIELQVMTVRTLTPGQREVVTSVDRPDGTRTEVALTLR